MSIADLRPPSRVGPECNGMLMTPEEFDSVMEWEEGYRYELLHGVLIVTPPPGVGERNPNDGRVMMIFRGSHEERIVREDETYTTDLLPGFELPLTKLLTIADRSGD